MVLCGVTFTCAPLYIEAEQIVITMCACVCLSVCPSVLKITHEQGDGCRRNLVDKGKE